MLSSEPGIQVFGGVPKTASLELSQGDVEHYIQELADLVEQHINLDAVLQSAAICEPLENEPPRSPSSPSGGKHVRIGVARDAAFCFYYQTNMNLLGGTIECEIPAHLSSWNSNLKMIKHDGDVQKREQKWCTSPR